MSERQDGRFTAADGTGIAFCRWSGERGPLLLHHGFAADTRVNWIAPGIVDRLVDAGFEVIALDARGHGRSDKPYDAAAYGEPAMARDVSALADHLGLERFVPVGYSMGAIVSLFVAAQDPRVTRLVIGGIGGRVVKGRALNRGAVATALEADTADGPDDRGAALFRQFAESTGADRLALAACIRAAGRERPAVDAITVPTLLVVGEADALARRPEELVEAISDARLETVPGDHLGAVGEPAFMAAILAFLEAA